MIDFSNINKLTGSQNAQNAPTTNESAGGDKLFTPDDKGANRGNSDGLGRLQQEADKNGGDLQRARDVYNEYQHNILAASEAKNAILKGIDKGESLCALLLQAAEAIARTTDDSVFAPVVKRKLVEVRGLGLGDPEALDMERQDIKARLDKLHAALEREQGTDRESGIKWAIRAHEQELQRIEKLMKQAENAD